MSSSQLYSRWKIIVAGVAVGAAYGLLLRASIQFHVLRNTMQVMSLAFLFAMPLAMGYFTVSYIERRRRQPIGMWCVLGWMPVAACATGLLIVGWEGFICIAMFLPIGMFFATLGGLLGGYTARVIERRRTKDISLACVALLPFLMSPWEQHAFMQKDFRAVESVIDIQASPATVWRNIERVPTIRAEELTPSWSRRIGFPRPVEATLTCPGQLSGLAQEPQQCIGGVRHATFAGGVLFIETIDLWQPQQRLAFSIHAETEKIPRTTLDKHVTVGGPFFDVLRGEYRLEPIGNGVRLHLLSRHRLSTDFNWYASLWTDAIMADLQRTILKVIKQRCEHSG